MKKGERALVNVGAEYFGSHDASGMISAFSALHYEVQLIDFTKVISKTLGSLGWYCRHGVFLKTSILGYFSLILVSRQTLPFLVSLCVLLTNHKSKILHFYNWLKISMLTR